MLHVVDLATGKEQRSFGSHNGNVVVRIAISPDAKWLVTAAGQKANRSQIKPHERFLRLWNLEEGTEVRTIDFPEDGGVTSLLFTQDSRTLIAAIAGAVRSWDVASGQSGRTWTDDSAMGFTLAISPDGKLLASMNRNGVIRLWDMATGAERHPLAASPCSLQAVCFRPDGKSIVTVGADLVFREWEATTGRLLSSPRVCGKGSSPSLIAGGRLLQTYVYKDRTSTCLLNDPATGKLVLEQPIFGVAVSPDGKRFAHCANRQDPVRILDIDTGKVIQTLSMSEEKHKSDWPHRPVPKAFTPDGHTLIVQGENLSVWDVETGKQKASWSLLKNNMLVRPPENKQLRWERIESLAVSPDGSTIALSLLKDRSGQGGPRDWFCRVMLVESMTGKLLHQVDVDDESFRQIKFSPDGKLLAAGGGWTVRVWGVRTGREVCQFEGHRGQITSLAFSPDGKRLASASDDSTVLVWDVTR